MSDRMLTRHFSNAELRCRCGRTDCDALPMERTFLAKLEALREAWGRPLAVTSGARCPTHNKAVGGSPRSQHLLGNAADLLVGTKNDAKALAALAEKVGMGGIGTGNGWIHVDDGPAGRRWTYAD